MSRARKTEQLRIVLVDDEEAILRLTAQLLRPKFEIVGTASNGREAVSMALQLQPDLLVMDIGIPVMHGMDVMALLHQKQVDTKVVFLSTFADRDLSIAAMASGARAFVFKAQIYTDLPRALDAILAGHTFVSSEETR